MNQKWITLKEAQAETHYSVNAIYSQVQRGTIPHKRRADNRILVRVYDVEKWKNRPSYRSVSSSVLTQAQRWIKAHRALIAATPRDGLKAAYVKFCEDTGSTICFDYWRRIVARMGLSWKKGQGRG